MGGSEPVKLVAPTLSAWRTCRDSNVIADSNPRPVDAVGGTPALWSDCVGWQVDEAAGTVADQDLLVAIHEAEKNGRLRAQDKGSRAKLVARLGPELTQAAADRLAGKKPGRSKAAKL